MDPATATLAAAAISSAASIGGGMLARGGNQETKNQKVQRKLLEKLVSSLSGQGPYSDLFNYSDEAFQKSFVEPAQSMFRNKIAPQIQQEYIASGQQRGTGLDDQLLRAGVDMDSLLNQHMMQYQENAKNRAMGAISSGLGVSPGAPPQQSLMGAGMQGLGGYISSPGFSDTLASLFKPKSSLNTGPQTGGITQRQGYSQGSNINYGSPAY